MSHQRIWLFALFLAFAASTGFSAFPGDSKPNLAPKRLSAAELAARIDAHIEAKLAAQGVAPAPLAADAEFLRRIYLDLAGRIPSEADARVFLADKSSDRRARLVEALLGSPHHVRNMGNVWQSVMFDNSATSTTQFGFRSWLDKQVQDNVGYDKMVRDLLTAPIFNPNMQGYAYNAYIYVPEAVNVTPPLSLNLLPRSLAPLPLPSAKAPAGLGDGSPSPLPPPKAATIGPPTQVPVLPNGVNSIGLSTIAIPPTSAPLVLTPLPKISTPSLATVNIDIVMTTLPPISTPSVVTIAYPTYTGYYAPPMVPQNTPGPHFFEANEYKAEAIAASTARRFLGVRLECAQCHNHPFASWTRKQFYEFAAFFSAVRPPAGNEIYTIALNPNGTVAAPPTVGKQPTGREIAVPGTDKVVSARFLDGAVPKWQDNVESRHTLAEWLTSPSNNLFARTGVNRLWAHFFGVGIIDPIDDEPTDENPISHPELLAELTEQFVAHKYDVKYLIRAITLSKAYQRASAVSHSNQNDPRLFARMAVKGLTAEQLYDNLAMATGFQEPPQQVNWSVPIAFGQPAAGTPRGDFLLTFTAHDRKTETQTSILQALTLMNGKLVTDATSVTGNQKLAALLSGKATKAEKIETLYLSTLSRSPRPEETARMLRHVDSHADERKAFADVFWALLNSAEFRFNH